jgi:hypothetical protein
MATGDPWWMALVREQLAAGFPAVAGTEVSATIPVSDRLLTRVVQERLPPSASIGDVDVHAHPGGRLTVRVRLARPAFLPAITLPVTIVRQPALPHDPVLVLRVGSPGGLLRLAGPFVRLIDGLPPGVTLEKDVVSVNLPAVLAASGAAFALDYLDQLEIGTAEGRVVLSFRARVPASRSAKL